MSISLPVLLSDLSPVGVAKPLWFPNETCWICYQLLTDGATGKHCSRVLSLDSVSRRSAGTYRENVNY